MSFGFLDWVAFLGTPLLASLIARSWKRDGTWSGYFYASSALGSLTVASTYLGANLTFTSIFLILSEEAYIRGYWVFSVPVCWVLGTLFFLYLYPDIKPFTDRSETLHEAMGNGYESSGIRLAASVWTIIAFCGTVGLEFYGAFILLSWAGVPNGANIAVAAVLAFITSYFTVTGGLRGVAAADYVLNGATFLAIIFLFIYARSAGPLAGDSLRQGAISTHQLSISDNVLFVVGMIIIFVPFQLCTLDSWQRLVSWKDKQKSPANWLAASGIGLAFIYCIPIAVGISVRNHHSLGKGVHPFQVFLSSLSAPRGIVGIIFGGFAAAILSTADELLNCCGLSMIFDTLQLSKAEQSKNTKSVMSGRLYTALFAFISALIALLAISFHRKISDLALAVFSTQVVFALPLLIMFRRKQHARELRSYVIAGMAGGFCCALGLVLAGWLSHSQDTVDAAPVGAFCLSSLIIIVGLVANRQHRRQRNAA